MGIKPKIAPSTVNVSDKVQDLSIIHAINLERIKADQVNGVLDILDDLGLSIQKQLEKIDPTGVGPTYRARRLARLLEGVKATTKQHFGKAQGANSKGLGKVSTVSAKATQNIINRSLGVSLGATLPSAAVLSSLAGRTLVEGQIVKDYWKQQSAEHTGKFMRQMRIGVAGGENLQSLIQRVRGTKANNFTDGIMNSTKRKAETLVRSSVAAVNNEALINTYQANEDLFNGYQWMATLDSRTSDICKARSGLTWDKDFKPVGHAIGWTPPPAHFNCRSTVIGILKPWSDLANKPLPAVGAETLKEELQKSLLSRGLSQALISKAINKTQQSMDGYVAGNINFEDWLKSKSERFQKQILGEPKMVLWKNGKIGFVDLVDQKSNPRSLAELEDLVNQGKTAPLKANKAAKEAAKEQAEAAALAVKAAQKAENRAQAQLDDIIAGTAGTNKSKVYYKLKKDGIGGLSATQIIAKIDEGVTQINVSANISKAKKKLKDGKKLNKTEEAAWATVDDDLKAAYLVSLEAESAVFKTIQDKIDNLEGFKELALATGTVQEGSVLLKAKKILEQHKDKKSGFPKVIYTPNDDYISKEINKILNKSDLEFLQKLAGFDGLASLKAKKSILSKTEAEAYISKYDEVMGLAQQVVLKNDEITAAAKAMSDSFINQLGVAKTLYKGDPDTFNFTKHGTPLSIKQIYIKSGPKIAKDNFDAITDVLADDIKKANDKIFAVQERQINKATQYLSDAAQGGKGFSAANVAYEKLKKSGGLTGDAVVDAAKVQAEKDAVQAAKSLASVKTGIKKKFKANKKLSPKEQQVFDDLDPVDQDLLKEAASAGKTAKQLDDDAAAIVTQKATQRADEGVLFDDLEQIGNQDGSNTGGLFKSKVDGSKFYVKAPDTEVMAKVEVLSSKLYQAAGVKVANVNSIKLTGKIGDRDVSGRLGVTSAIEEIEDIDTSQMGALSGAKDGFAADAWLANWDVVGNGGPKQLNLKKMPDGSSFRIDTGGTLFFRAQGGRKAFSASEIPELDSLRFNSYNSGEVFGDISEDQIVAGVARIVAISDDDIRRLVKDTMGDDADDLAEVLIGRKNVLQATYAKQLAKYNKKVKRSPLERVTKQEEQLIKESRVNGYIMTSDKGDIEDHEIRASYLKRKGKGVTQLNLRLRPDAMQKLQKTLLMKSGGDLPDIEMSNLNYDIKRGIRGIMARGNAGSPFRDVDFQRSATAIQAIEQKKKEIEDLVSQGRLKPDDLERFEFKTGTVLNIYKSFVERYKIGDKKLERDLLFKEKFEDILNFEQIPLTSAKATKTISWTDQGAAKFYKSSFRDSYSEQDGERFTTLGTVFDTEVDGVRVRYFPENQSESHAALVGRMEVEIDGASAVEIKKGLGVIEQLGIDASRSTAMDREELYLTKIFYHFSGVKRGDQDSELYALLFKDEIKRISKIGSQNERIKELKRLSSSAADVKDITALPMYNPVGEFQQFGHGKALQLNPVFQGKEWEKFHDDHRIYHDLEYGKGHGTQVGSFKAIVGGGGQLASTTDRMRRGIPFGEGGSEGPDVRSGGASYIFSRLREKSDITREHGLVWKTNNHVRRLDAMSFKTDYYGSQKFSNGKVYKKYDNLDDWDVSLQERAVDLQAFKNHAVGNDNNEIIFKDGLSLFEDLEFFVVRPNEKQDVLDFLTEKGYKKWPDGRKLEEVIVTKDDIRNLVLGKKKAYADAGVDLDDDIDLDIDIDIDDDELQILDE